MVQKDANTSRISRKNAVGMDDLIKEYIQEMQLSSGLDRQRIFSIWDEVTGAGRYTTSKSFFNSTLQVKISSSVVRSQLMMQRMDILREINSRLLCDELFTGGVGPDGKQDPCPVKSILLQ